MHPASPFVFVFVFVVDSPLASFVFASFFAMWSGGSAAERSVAAARLRKEAKRSRLAAEEADQAEQPPETAPPEIDRPALTEQSDSKDDDDEDMPQLGMQGDGASSSGGGAVAAGNGDGDDGATAAAAASKSPP